MTYELSDQRLQGVGLLPRTLLEDCRRCSTCSIRSRFPRARRPADHGLIPLRLESWAGFLFVNLDETGEPLRDYLGDLPELPEEYSAGGRLDQPEHGSSEGRLAAAALAHQPQGLLAVHREVDVVDRAYVSHLAPKHPLAHREVFFQGPYLEQRCCAAHATTPLPRPIPAPARSGRPPSGLPRWSPTRGSAPGSAPAHTDSGRRTRTPPAA